MQAFIIHSSANKNVTIHSAGKLQSSRRACSHVAICGLTVPAKQELHTCEHNESCKAALTTKSAGYANKCEAL